MESILQICNLKPIHSMSRTDSTYSECIPAFKSFHTWSRFFRSRTSTRSFNVKNRLHVFIIDSRVLKSGYTESILQIWRFNRFIQCLESTPAFLSPHTRSRFFRFDSHPCGRGVGLLLSPFCRTSDKCAT